MGHFVELDPTFSVEPFFILGFRHIISNRFVKREDAPAQEIVCAFVGFELVIAVEISTLDSLLHSGGNIVQVDDLDLPNQFLTRRQA